MEHSVLIFKDTKAHKTWSLAPTYPQGWTNQSQQDLILRLLLKHQNAKSLYHWVQVSGDYGQFPPKSGNKSNAAIESQEVERSQVLIIKFRFLNPALHWPFSY